MSRTPVLSRRPYEPGRSSVVVPLHGGLAVTRLCVEALRAQREACGEPWELVLVDNGSPDGTRAWLLDEAARAPWLRPVLHDANLGFAGGCNAGLEAARGEWLAVLNNDTVPATSMLRRLREGLAAVPDAGLCAPVSDFVMGRQCIGLDAGEDFDDALPGEALLAGSDAVASRLARETGGRLEESDKLAGLCLLGHRSFFEEVGLFDPAYGIGNFEDDDLCLRARLAGRRLLIRRDAFVHHWGSRTFTSLGLDYRAQYVEQRELHARRWQACRLARVERLREDGDDEGVLAETADLGPDEPGRTWCLRARALALGRLGREVEALPALRAFVAAHPLVPDTSCQLALALLATGHERAGRLLLARTLRDCWLEDELAASVLVGLARHCRTLGRRDEAARHLEAALALRPDFVPGTIVASAWLLDEARWSAARDLLLPLAERDDADVHANLGIAEFRLGNVDEALRRFTRGAELGGPGSPAADNLARLSAALGRAPAAARG